MMLVMENWDTVCEFLPLSSLHKFKLSNKTLFNCIKNYCPNIEYNKDVNYDDILAQLINITTHFVIFTFIDYKKHYDERLLFGMGKHFIVIKNNLTSDKKILFTVSQIVCAFIHRPYQNSNNCVYEKVNEVLSHVPEVNYCWPGTANIININCTDNTYSKTHDRIHYTAHIHSDELQLNIVNNSHLNFTSSGNNSYNEEQYKQTHCVKNCTQGSEKHYSIHNVVNGVPMYIPNKYMCGGTITKYNFVLDNVEEIYKNVFILENRVISYFVKNGITFYIMMENNVKNDNKCNACQTHNNCKTCCETCGGVCRVCGAKNIYNSCGEPCPTCNETGSSCNSTCKTCNSGCCNERDISYACNACGVCYDRYTDCSDLNSFKMHSCI